MRVLLVDDQPALRSALRLLLEHEAQMEVVGEAGSVGMARACVDALHPDLLFLDWGLPGLKSNSARQQLMAAMHAIDANLYIIALIQDDNAARCLLLGADAFVDKAEPPERLLAVLRQAVNRKSRVPHQAAENHPLL